MALKTWRNHDKAHVVQKIIENNFRILGKHLPHNLLSLSTEERNLLSEDYLSDGLIVYDTTFKNWFEYNAKTGTWKTCPIETSTYVQEFKENNWTNNTIFIPYSEHLISNPIIKMFILYKGSYHPVLGEVEVDTDFNITLLTDMPFAGRVVIK